MNVNEATKLFKEIQNGRGTGDLRDKFLKEFGAGEAAKSIWDTGEFTLGVEYGMLIALQNVYNLNKGDLKCEAI